MRSRFVASLARVGVNRPQACRANGYSLIEVLVALAIIAVLMLGVTGIYVQQRNVTRRMEAQRAADRALENLYERIRIDGPPAGDVILPPAEPGGPTVSVTVLPGTVPGTWRVDLVATYEVANHPFRRTLVALVRP